MGLEWILLDRPKPGYENEYYQLTSRIDDALQAGSGRSPAEVGMVEHAPLDRLGEISITPEETWRAFLSERWEVFRHAVDRSMLPQEAVDLTPLSWDALWATLIQRFPRNPLQRFDFLHALLGDPALGSAPWTTRRLCLLWNGWDDGDVWRRLYEPIVEIRLWQEVDHDSSATAAVVNARRLQDSACRTVRALFPELSPLDNEAIAARFDTWGEYQWRRDHQLTEAGGPSMPSWRVGSESYEIIESGSPEDDDAAEIALTDPICAGIQIFDIVEWLRFWGERGHGFIRIG